VRSQSQNEKNMKKIIFVCLIVVMCFSLSSKESNEVLSEVYEKKVIIDAKWGDKPGEFGVEFSAPPAGPGPYIFDSFENIYIKDRANKRIQKYDKDGNFIDVLAEGERIIFFEMLNDTIFAVKRYYELLMIDIRTGEVMKRRKLKIQIPQETAHCSGFYGIEKEGDNIFALIGKERYRIKRGENFGEMIRVSEPKKVDSLEISYNSLRTVGFATVKRDCKTNKFTIKDHLGHLGYILFHVVDKNSRYYFEVGGVSSDSNSIYVFEKDKRLIAKIKLPPYSENLCQLRDPLQITLDGDIFYLKASGEFDPDWDKMDFKAGKIQLIKWTLKK